MSVAGQLRATTSIRTPQSRTRCRSPILGPLSCADSLVVELGPAAVIPELRLAPALRAELDDAHNLRPRLLSPPMPARDRG